MTDWRLSEISYFIFVTDRGSKNCDFIPCGSSSKVLFGFVILVTTFFNDQFDAIHRRNLNWATKRRELNYQVRNDCVTLSLVRMHIHSLELNTERFWWKLFAHDRVCFSNSRVWEPWWQCHVCEARWLLASFSRANGSLYFCLARLMCLLGFALLGIYPSASSLHTYVVETRACDERVNSQSEILSR